MKITKTISAIAVSAFFTCNVMAQRDTSAPTTVTIISAYKPVARSAAKINLSGSPLQADTVKMIKPYKIPSQQLMYGYQPISLKPLAMDIDSMPFTGPRYYVKAGFGNYSTPYIKAAARYGDGTKMLINVFGDYTSSKGKIENQNFSNLSLKATGSYFLNHHELYSALHYDRNQYYLYGYDHSLFSFTKKNISHQFDDIRFSAGLKNSSKNESGWNYNPSLMLNYFGFTDTLSEFGAAVIVPVEKRISDAFALKINAGVDFTAYSTKNRALSDTSFNNVVVSAIPSFSYYTDKFKMDGGVGIFSDNGRLFFLPNVYGEFALSKKNLIVQGGWIGRVNKNTYRNLSLINPYLGALTTRQNTVETELYGGVKLAIGKHLQLSGKAGIVSYRDFQFFINDPYSNGKSFALSGEDNVNNFKIHADMSYILRDVLTVNGGVTFNGYTGMKANSRAWNTVPMEANASLRWMPYNKITVRSEFYLFAGGHYIGQNNEDLKFNGATDLSIGAEYRITEKIGAFLDLNNIFGKSYERWHNYKVYGISVVGGITVRF